MNVYVLCLVNEMVVMCVVIIRIFLKINGYFFKIKCFDYLYKFLGY